MKPPPRHPRLVGLAAFVALMALLVGLDAAMAAEHAAFELLADAVSSAQAPELGEVLTAYESGARLLLQSTLCAALEVLGRQA